jgi:hypothetical protein
MRSGRASPSISSPVSSSVPSLATIPPAPSFPSTPSYAFKELASRRVDVDAVDPFPSSGMMPVAPPAPPPPPLYSLPLGDLTMKTLAQENVAPSPSLSLLEQKAKVEKKAEQEKAEKEATAKKAEALKTKRQRAPKHMLEGLKSLLETHSQTSQPDMTALLHSLANHEPAATPVVSDSTSSTSSQGALMSLFESLSTLVKGEQQRVALEQRVHSLEQNMQQQQEHNQQALMALIQQQQKILQEAESDDDETDSTAATTQTPSDDSK